MSSTFLPLSWESTGDQWWHASPIEWAAANGHYDLVRELLRLDSNHLIHLTSLRRIRRLETVWDDQAQFDNVAKFRSSVARQLFFEPSGDHSLISGGYGGWLMYTAASAGDAAFVRQLLQKDPLLVFGGGEYDVSDVLYAAARSNNSEVFMLLFEFSILHGGLMTSFGELEQEFGEVSPVFKWEMKNRAVHAAARGGNLEILTQLLRDCSNVLDYTDVSGSTVLHSASGRGQVEVVKYLVAAFGIINSTDSQGNSALHIAAFHGQVAVVESLILTTPSSVYITNNSGDTFLHTTVAGFKVPGFQILEKHMELVKNLVSGKWVKTQDVINVRNNVGRTALHIAVTGKINSNLVEILMEAPGVDINIQDIEGMTPLDVLKQQLQTLASDILIKQFVLAGGYTNCEDHRITGAAVSNLKMQAVGSSPGTCFTSPDCRILSDMDVNGLGAASSRTSLCSSRVSDNIKQGSVSNRRRHLKSLLSWSRQTSNAMLSMGNHLLSLSGKEKISSEAMQGVQ